MTTPLKSTERILVSIDPDLKNIIPVFLANRHRDLERLRSCLAAKDFVTIRLLGHRLKGDGGGYGFQAITDLGDQIELAAGRRDYPAVERLTMELQDFLARVTVSYR